MDDEKKQSRWVKTLHQAGLLDDIEDGWTLSGEAGDPGASIRVDGSGGVTLPPPEPPAEAPAGDRPVTLKQGAIDIAIVSDAQLAQPERRRGSDPAPAARPDSKPPLVVKGARATQSGLPRPSRTPAPATSPLRRLRETEPARPAAREPEPTPAFDLVPEAEPTPTFDLVPEPEPTPTFDLVPEPEPTPTLDLVPEPTLDLVPEPEPTPTFDLVPEPPRAPGPERKVLRDTAGPPRERVARAKGRISVAPRKEQRDRAEALQPIVDEAPVQRKPRRRTTRPPEAAGERRVWMEERLAIGDYSGALSAAEEILAGTPGDAEAKRVREECRRVLIGMYEARIGPFERVPKVLVSTHELIWRNLDAATGFVLSRIDGLSTFEDVVDVSGLPRFETCRILSQLLNDGIIG